MVNKPKNIGTATETAVVRYLRDSGFPKAERLALHGNLDEGDIVVCPGVIIEVKGGKAAETASDAQIQLWLDESEAERVNRGADICPLVLKRKGKGTANTGLWWAYLPGWAFVSLVTEERIDNMTTVRLLLTDLVDLIRVAGYGEAV